MGPHNETLLDALDSVYVKCGLRNFADIRNHLIPTICSDKSKLMCDLIDLTNEVKITVLFEYSKNINVSISRSNNL